MEQRNNLMKVLVNPFGSGCSWAMNNISTILVALKSSPNFCRVFHSSDKWFLSLKGEQYSAESVNQFCVWKSRYLTESVIWAHISLLCFSISFTKKEKALNYWILISEKLSVNVKYYNLPVQATAENLHESHWKLVSSSFCCLPRSSHVQLKLEKLLFMFPLLGAVATAYLLNSGFTSA